MIVCSQSRSTISATESVASTPLPKIEGVALSPSALSQPLTVQRVTTDSRAREFSTGVTSASPLARFFVFFDGRRFRHRCMSASNPWFRGVRNACDSSETGVGHRPWHTLNFLPLPQGHGSFIGMPQNRSRVLRGLNAENARPICDALNATLELADARYPISLGSSWQADFLRKLLFLEST